MKVTESLLRTNMFGAHPYAHVIIAYVTPVGGREEKPAGFALYFYNVLSWEGSPGVYMNDLFVCPEYRGLGVGKRLLVQLAQMAKDKQFGRVKWPVLDWNEPSIQFYLGLGAKQMKEWITHRVSGPALDKLAGFSHRAAGW
ncbi:acetyltransferase [Coemansia aciculifera]|uniref:Acetyltransferase n=1 Tax=Coemansia aciculifera TaxID=417176 RepID=A0ACC1M4C6_9FUNG|nr:acetyltransferase [Coemansia aciculifera]